MTILALVGGGAGAAGGGAGAIGELAKMVTEIVKAASKQQGGENEEGGRNKIAGEDMHSHNGQMQYAQQSQTTINVHNHG